MHRWFFATEREACAPLEPEDAEPKQEVQNQKDTVKEIIYTDFPFCVKVKKVLQGNECVAISGNCDALGNWQPNRVHLMQAVKCHGESQCCCPTFGATVRIPRNKDVEYRYCIVGYDPLIEQDIIIRYWEVMPRPRLIRTCDNTLRLCEIFGKHAEFGEESRIDRGWATVETIVQFKIFNAPFVWLQQPRRLLHVHLQPMYELEPTECRVRASVEQPLRLTTVEVLPSESSRSTALAFAEVANLKCSQRLHYQAVSGSRCGPDDLQLYHCSIRYPEQTLYRLDLYTYAHKAAADEPAYHYGYGFIRPEQLIDSEGQLRVKISCASTHRPLIEMCLRYLIIRPLAAISSNLSCSFERYWRAQRSALDIGHRGTGNTYRLAANVHRENTLYAFKQAALHDAHLVELDVHLTQDAQVVVHHDHVLRFSLASAACAEKLLDDDYDVWIFPHEHLNRLQLLAMGGVKRGQHLVVPLEAFTYEQLRLAQPLRFAASNSDACGTDCDLTDQLPFPLLSDVFSHELSDKLGICIELKWPQQVSRRRWEGDGFRPTFDRNFYVDTILEIVFRLAGKRRIIFASFDADICVMLRYKQNLYPVTLLLLHAEQPVQFLDQRVSIFENAANFAYIMEFFGLNLHSGWLLKQPLSLGLIKDLRMQLICWGPDNNDELVRSKLKRYGVVAVVYDRIDQFDQQLGEQLQGIVCCIDSMATRNYIRRLQDEERQLKCGKRDWNVEEAGSLGVE
ncbi:glycerophosphocholine phosphodiesterase GPCPD1 [Drosophila grimshawi]|uniref:GH10111 n=1 Tax=Drosophila grimshawi TaxID=7222 RepID=B4JCN9_DROGR|nr:glycerophosphocholine phosphodiesterase GPCPD1 [Drosophila grimshawi]EDW04203.1 GH10111 [Drosophila grimshawi]